MERLIAPVGCVFELQILDLTMVYINLLKFMELPYGVLNSYNQGLVEQQEQNKIQTPFEDKKPQFELKMKQKRPKKLKAEGVEEKVRTRKIVEPGREIGHWNNQEKRKYHWFLEIYHNHFENKHMRRMDKIFKTMADFLGSRAADQCRSHHQKMQKKYKNFYNILYNLRVFHYGTSNTTELMAELNQMSVFSQGDLISESQLEHFMQEKEENHQPTHIPQTSYTVLNMDSPKWPDHDFEKYNIERPLELLMDLSNEQFNLI